MRYNLYWLAIKQFRLSYWLYEKLFYLGLAIHVRRKYGKWNPSVADIIRSQHGGKLYSYEIGSLSWSGLLRDGDNVGTWRKNDIPLPNKMKGAYLVAKDILDGKLDYDPILREHFYSQFLATMHQIKLNKEIK
jgi:hypothetical protein